MSDDYITKKMDSDAEGEKIDLSISEIIELMDEEEGEKFLERIGMDPEMLLQTTGKNSLSNIDKIGMTGTVGKHQSGPTFSNIHLQTAVELSDQVEAFEEVPEQGGEWGSKMNWGLVIGSITSCMSFLDTVINEFVDDIGGSKLPFHAETREEIENAGFDRQFQQRLDRLESELITWEHTSTLQKYQIVLTISDHDLFNKGSNPYQDVDTVRRLRNYFVHYDPEMYEHNTDESEHRLGSALQGKFEENPLAEDHEPFFPNKILSHGCTEWCIESSINFTDDFFDRLGLVPHYRRYDHTFHFGDIV